MAEKFNYHKVIFTLETIKSPEEKISYLFGVKVDLNRVIQCFSRKKFQALKKYAKHIPRYQFIINNKLNNSIFTKLFYTIQILKTE